MAYSDSVIRTILRVGADMGMNQRQLITALQAGIVESGLRNLRYGDRDSQGVFQQRPSMGWGSVAQVTNPEYAARKFFSELKKVWDPDKTNGHNAQHVQRSAFPERYQQRLGEAQKIYRQFGGDTGRKKKSGKPDEPQVSFDDDDDLTPEILSPAGEGYEFDDDFQADEDDLEIDNMWAEAVQVMGDSVRGQYDPNGDIFDEPGDVDELVSPDQYDRMLSGQASLMGGGSEVQLFDEDDDIAELTPASVGDLGAQQQDQQRKASAASLGKSRQRAFDMLDALQKAKKQGSGGLPKFNFGGSSQSIPGGLKPNAARAARVVRDMGFGGTIGGIGGRGYKSDHPHGGAIDVMTGLSSKGNKVGWQIAKYFHANRGRYGIKYIIFDNRIASSVDNWRWRTYNSTPDGNTSRTARHEDHVHLSVHY